MTRILIATEGSQCSQEAVRTFAHLFQPGVSEVYLLAVIPLATQPEGHPMAAEHYHRVSEEAQEALGLATADLAVAGYSAFGLVRVGEPATKIVEVALELRADMLVLGTHGRQGLEKLLKGSVAEAVLQAAPCAVLIYPQLAQAHTGLAVRAS